MSQVLGWGGATFPPATSIRTPDHSKKSHQASKTRNVLLIH